MTTKRYNLLNKGDYEDLCHMGNRSGIDPRTNQPYSVVVTDTCIVTTTIMDECTVRVLRLYPDLHETCEYYKSL